MDSKEVARHPAMMPQPGCAVVTLLKDEVGNILVNEC